MITNLEQASCPLRGIAPRVHASLNCYIFFVTQAMYIKEVYIFFKAKRLMNPTMSMN